MSSNAYGQDDSVFASKFENPKILKRDFFGRPENKVAPPKDEIGRAHV